MIIYITALTDINNLCLKICSGYWNEFTLSDSTFIFDMGMPPNLRCNK